MSNRQTLETPVGWNRKEVWSRQPRLPLRGFADNLPALVFSAAYLFYLGALIPSIRFARGQDFYPGAGDPISTVVQATILVALFAYVVIVDRRSWKLAGVAAPYLLLVAFCVGSFLWSPFPEVTLRRSAALVGCLLLAVFAYTTLGLRRTIALIATVTTIAAIASLLVYAVLPDVGRELDIYGGGLRGIFAQKNALAGAMLPGIASYLFLWVKAPGRRAPLAQVAFLLGVIVFAGSLLAISIGLLLIAIALLVVVSPKRGAKAALVYAYASMATVAIVVVVVFPSEVAAFLGRDLTLTGRVGLWNLSLDYIANRPAFGYGYAGFWNLAAQETQYVHYYLNWPAPDAHNGYLDLLLQLGILGAAIVTWIVLRLVALCVKGRRAANPSELPWIILIVTTVLIINLGESRLIEPGWSPLLVFVSWLALNETNRKSARNATLVNAFGNRRPVRLALRNRHRQPPHERSRLD